MGCDGMYRVVLVDDENIIVEGLRRVVKWAEYNCEVVGAPTTHKPVPTSFADCIRISFLRTSKCRIGAALRCLPALGANFPICR